MNEMDLIRIENRLLLVEAWECVDEEDAKFIRDNICLLIKEVRRLREKLQVIRRGSHERARKA